jgi:hypothetical protein
LANSTAARTHFSRVERRLNAKLLKGGYRALNAQGADVQVVSPTYDQLSSSLSSCPKG